MNIPAPMIDVIDASLAIAPGSRLDKLRAARPDVRKRTQSSYDALFDPPDEKGLPLQERFAVAWRVAERSGSAGLAVYYRGRLERLSALRDGMTERRLAAIFHHADLVALEPRVAMRKDLQALSNAGLDEASIVTLSQIIAFVAYQVRVAATLTVLKEYT